MRKPPARWLAKLEQPQSYSAASCGNLESGLVTKTILQNRSQETLFFPLMSLDLRVFGISFYMSNVDSSILEFGSPMLFDHSASIRMAINVHLRTLISCEFLLDHHDG